MVLFCRFGDAIFDSFENLVIYHNTKGVPLGGEKAVLTKLIRPITKKMIERNKLTVVKKLNNNSPDQSFQVQMADHIEAYMKRLQKRIPKVSLDRELLFAEIQFISSMTHNNVASCYGLVEDQERIVLLSEIFSDGCIREHLIAKRYTDKEKCCILLDIAKGIQFLHRHQIVHRNISASEVFASSSKTSVEKSYKISGTEWYKINILNKRRANINEERLPSTIYMAPESLIRNSFSRQSDIWNFGVFIWEIVSNGATPYGDLKPNEKLEEFLLKGGRLKIPDNVQKELKSLMEKCWQQDPNARPFIGDIVVILEGVKRSAIGK